MPDYVFTVRNKRGDGFSDTPGTTRFLSVPPSATAPKPEHQIRKTDWIRGVIAEGTRRINPATGMRIGDIVMYIHGFNNSSKTMLHRHRSIKAAFEAEGFQGIVISFDWPSAESSLNYLDDRWDAKSTANLLVKEGIASFARLQEPHCEINLHLMAHSMGCFVVREAFDDADDRPMIAANSWSVSQVLLFGADVSASSLQDDSSKSSSLYRHCNRLTNYFNPFDHALSLSNIKRIGVAPRAGRVGLPPNIPGKAVDVDCGSFYELNKHRYDEGDIPGHRWYFEDPVFLRDAYLTILGGIDRNRLPTRAGDHSRLRLITPVELG